MKELIVVHALVQAPAGTVWESAVNPEHIQGWNHASEDWHTPEAVSDLRPGGTFCYTMAAKDGSLRFDFAGTFTEIIPLELLRYELADGREVRMDFLQTPEGVSVTTSFFPEEHFPAEKQQEGWQAILDNFKKYTESL